MEPYSVTMCNNL